MSKTLALVQSLIHTRVYDLAPLYRENFCKDFVKIATFMEWTYRFTEVITLATVYAIYDQLVSNCLSCVDDMNDNDLIGKNVSFSASTGRISVFIVYYPLSETCIFKVTMEP